MGITNRLGALGAVAVASPAAAQQEPRLHFGIGVELTTFGRSRGCQLGSVRGNVAPPLANANTLTGAR